MAEHDHKGDLKRTAASLGSPAVGPGVGLPAMHPISVPANVGLPLVLCMKVLAIKPTLGKSLCACSVQQSESRNWPVVMWPGPSHSCTHE